MTKKQRVRRLPFFLSILSLASASYGLADSSRKALVIGNGRYPSLCSTETPIHNAVAMGGVLQKIAFETTQVEDISLMDMAARIPQFLSAIAPNDIVFLYFSGLAISVDGQIRLLPSSFRPEDRENADTRAYSLDRILEDLKAAKPKAAIVVLDVNRRCEKLVDTLAGANPPQPETGILIAFADRLNATDDDSKDGSPNLFTTQLIRNLQEPGLEPVRVFDRTEEEVNRQSGGKQDPIAIHGARIDEAFYFTKPRPLAPPVKAGPKPGEERLNPNDDTIYSWIPGQTFLMGCVQENGSYKDATCAEDEKPQHEVSFDKGFWISSTKITVLQYDKFAQKKGRKGPRRTQTNANGRNTDRPVTEVSWQDALDYCSSLGGRLPTEAEWEAAARGGKENWIYPWGDEFDPNLANSFEKSEVKRKKGFVSTTPVHFYQKNGYNLLDAVGNVREWTMDVYDPLAYKAPPPFHDPLVKNGPKDVRVVRGGTWDEKSDYLRISQRDHHAPEKGDNQTGFRCVLPGLPE